MDSRSFDWAAPWVLYSLSEPIGNLATSEALDGPQGQVDAGCDTSGGDQVASIHDAVVYHLGSRAGKVSQRRAPLHNLVLPAAMRLAAGFAP
ncbi:MAG: hypothetical protein ACRDQH_13800 [Pseudonocardiaceae bacterium]